MSKRQNEISQQRKLQFEQFEERLNMSAQAVASLLPELDIAAPAITQQSVSLEESATTHAASIAAEYGFDGNGQTVAVIDSGIAWDHHALGNGYGEGAKVVGGWDFAENDANPYDDGPAGFHGTHVAGVIGSTDSQFQGVSSGVDLVALRVFTDAGEGNMEWVEQALQWVHEHKNDFANPITTVNLSLGTEFDIESDDWVSLEDEFAKLEAEGLFISVAAGNSFKTFGTPGVAYPAVSDHVVPVSSHDADGNMSDFSQRDQRVLVAPGESIRSTVPDHLFGGTSGNEFLGSTGTSMSAPYVAGASAVLRQANEFMGVENVDQDMLYQQFRETADRVYDAVTGGYYYNINLDAALEAVVKDRHADLAETATDLGTVRGGETIEGTIGKLSDVDVFEFTAQSTGQITLDFFVTDDLTPMVEIDGTNAQINGHEITFNVVAGEKYNFAVATADGSGHYKIDVQSSSSGNSGSETAQGGVGSTVNWGHIVSKQVVDQAINGNQTFELTTVREGLLTIESTINAGTDLTLEVYDSQMNLVGSGQSSNGKIRMDLEVSGREKHYVKAIGNAGSVDFRVSNLVSLDDSGTLSVHGTHLSDDISVTANNGFNVNVNGVEFKFGKSVINEITLIGHQGNDSIDIQLGQENDRVNTRVDGISTSNDQFKINAYQFTSVSVDGGGGNDLVTMIGSNQQDTVIGSVVGGKYTTALSGQNFTASTSGFEMVHVIETGGVDSVSLTGSSGKDVFVSRGERTWLRASDTTLVMVDGFDSIALNGGGGNDHVNLYDSVGNDQFVLNPGGATLNTDSYQVTVSQISRINAFSTSGNDFVTFNDSVGDDVFTQRDDTSVMYGEGYNSYASGFANVVVNSTSGNDFAQVHDTAGNDNFFSNQGDTKMVAAGLTVETNGFKQVNLIARNGGYDRATLVGTDREDVVLADVDSSRLKMSNGQTTRAVGFEETQIDTAGGIDLAFIVGSEGQETLNAAYSDVELETTLQLLRMSNVEHTHFEGNGGNDIVEIEEVGELDLIKSLGNEAVAYLQDHTVNAVDFALLEARSVESAIAEYDLDKVDFQYLLKGTWKQK